MVGCYDCYHDHSSLFQWLLLYFIELCCILVFYIIVGCLGPFVTKEKGRYKCVKINEKRIAGKSSKQLNVILTNNNVCYFYNSAYVYLSPYAV